MTAEEQLAAIMPKTAQLQEDCDKYYAKALENLAACGYRKVDFDKLSKEDEHFWKSISRVSFSPSSVPRSWTAATRSRSCAIRRSISASSFTKTHLGAHPRHRTHLKPDGADAFRPEGQ